ncbi:protein TolR [Solemya pervernicosa gill symbiont]|uniref:Tol-Pal system protein TolR n=2 Tax=Gammaproteobacteria incertae sedis TaxID=118884 RepID=A0A1T2L508_9GAMM|nr:protein TolR [Candidatus Reidiella endopervernicosa]OOZ40151.1 protein TolR [Solemya pervernicosa gill symbiont]QKQ28303.1 protein TolR [Candidatus Reidiella endopervernicosa]
MQKGRKRRRPIAEINVVPYIDVMLVLLVIFMITAPLLTQGVTVDLPQADAEPLKAEDREPLVVSVDVEGRYFLNVGNKVEKPIEPEILKAQVAKVLKLQPKTPVMVRGDNSVDYGRVVEVMALLQEAGAPSVGLMADPRGQDK